VIGDCTLEGGLSLGDAGAAAAADGAAIDCDSAVGRGHTHGSL
jgi:hypothetical protein